MTQKQDFLGQGVDDLRSSLQGMFEDPDGEFESMNKPALLDFARANWDTIEGLLPTDDPVEEDEEVEEEAEEVEEEVEEEEAPLDPESPEEESPVTEEADKGDWKGNPKTNLHTGAPGARLQRTGTRDLA